MFFFLFVCDKHCQGKAICYHFIWRGTKVGEEGGLRKLHVSRNSAKLGNYKMPVKLRET